MITTFKKHRVDCFPLCFFGWKARDDLSNLGFVLNLLVILIPHNYS
jgi:hypothetical protein